MVFVAIRGQTKHCYHESSRDSFGSEQAVPQGVSEIVSNLGKLQLELLHWSLGE